MSHVCLYEVISMYKRTSRALNAKWMQSFRTYDIFSLTKCVEQGSWEASSHSPSQEVYRFTEILYSLPYLQMPAVKFREYAMDFRWVFWATLIQSTVRIQDKFWYDLRLGHPGRIFTLGFGPKLYIDLLTYLLTYSMQQSPSWEANWFCS